MSATTSAPKRADARRNVEAIVEAATALLATDPDASVAQIAAAAGVGRVTLYGHFASRADLVRAVAERAIAQTEDALAGLDVSGDPRAALVRLLEASWHLTHRFGALVVAAEHVLTPEALRRVHDDPAARMAALLERGRAAGAFRDDVPVAWQLSTVQAIMHAASAAVHRGEVTAEDAPALVATTTLAALSG